MKLIWLFLLLAACTVHANPTEPPVYFVHTTNAGQYGLDLEVVGPVGRKLPVGTHIFIQGVGERVVREARPKPDETFETGAILHISHPATWQQGAGVALMPRELNPDGTPRMDPRDQ